MKVIRVLILACSLGCLCAGFSTRAPSQTFAGPLRVNPANPRYFTDGTGKAVYLTGSHTWNNLKDSGTSDPPPAFDYNGYLDFLESHHHNFIRLWAWGFPKCECESEDMQFTEPLPWPRNGPDLANDGKPKFDLSQFNESYFERLRRRVIAAGFRGIYVSIMLFDGYGIRFCRIANDGHPFDGSNNINGINPASSIFTLDNPAALAIQKAYVRKVVDTVNDLNNVLYEIANEAGSQSTAWQYEMINTLNAYQATLPQRHPVGMTFQAADGLNSTLFDSMADWISPGLVSFYGVNPPPGDGSKVILSDTDHIYGVGGDFDWVWRTFTRGHNPIYMDPWDSNATREGARLAMGHALDYANRLDLVNTRPRGDLTSTTYALANPGVEYLVYQPVSSSFTVDLTGTSATFTVEWFNPTLGTASLSAKLTGGRRQRFKAPFAGPALLYLRSSALPAEASITVKVTSPQPGTGFAAPPPTITLTATAADRYNSVRQVVFHDNATPLATVTTSPYGMPWNNATTGTHILTAHATNSLGATVVSTPVTITVGASPTLKLVALTNGVARHLLLGYLGATYRIEATTDLLDWTSLQNATVERLPDYPGGAAITEDPQSVNFPARFYRAILSP